MTEGTKIDQLLKCKGGRLDPSRKAFVGPMNTETVPALTSLKEQEMYNKVVVMSK